MSQEFLTAFLAITTANMKVNVGLSLNKQELQVQYKNASTCDEVIYIFRILRVLYVMEKHFQD